MLSEHQTEITRTGTTGMPASGDRADGLCAACPHPLDAHDVIGLRYCAATAVGTSTRGCVCVSHIGT
jgi:hypothetical protein